MFQSLYQIRSQGPIIQGVATPARQNLNCLKKEIQPQGVNHSKGYGYKLSQILPCHVKSWLLAEFVMSLDGYWQEIPLPPEV